MSVRDLSRLNKPMHLDFSAELSTEISWYKKPPTTDFKFNCLIYELVMLNNPSSITELFTALKGRRTANNFIREFSLLDVIEHYLMAITKNNEDYGEVVKFRDMLLKYDTENLLTKKQKGYDSTCWYGLLMFAPNVLKFSMDFGNLIKILSTPKLRNDIGDRLRYFKFNDPQTYKLLGITPYTVADMILSHPYIHQIKFEGLKSPRQKIANFIKNSDFLSYYLEEENDEIFDDRDTLFAAYTILKNENHSQTYAYIQGLLLGVYFDDYTQWVDHIRVGGETCPKFTVHHHTLLREIYSEDFTGIEDINWRLHPQDNFSDIIEHFIEEQEELLTFEKPSSNRKPVDIPEVKELVYARELVKVGEDMNICIGGSYYIHYLPCILTHYYQLGNGKPEDRIIAELKFRGKEWQLVQAVTVGNKVIKKDHPHYGTLVNLKAEFGVTDYWNDSYSNMPANLQQTIIHKLSLIGKS